MIGYLPEMNETSIDGRWSPTRRTVLGSIAGVATGATSGCVQRVRSLVNRTSPQRASLTIKTLPADSDESATRIARHLATNLNAAGVDAEVTLLAEDELRRQIFINHDFDLYVTQHPGRDDPDFLRPLLHSVFASESGLQNPFGFADLTVDDLLTDQRRYSGARRMSALHSLHREIARQQPLTSVVSPDEIRAARADRYVGWSDFDSHSPLDFATLSPAAEIDDADPRKLRVTITDDRVTKNLNPIAIEYRNRGTFTGMIYDSLGHRYDGEVHPWMAKSWSWERRDGGHVATVRLRDDLEWHDGRPLTAADVAFTYRFLADTSLGRGDTTVPTPRFRGHTSLVGGVEEIDDRTLRFTFPETSRAVAARAFTVPVFPAHVWRPKAVDAGIAGWELFEGVTEALVWSNPQPVGSGPLRFERRIPEETLILSRNDEHFLNRDGEGVDSRFAGGLPFDELVVRVVPSNESAVALLAAGEADATITSLDAATVPHVGRHDRLQLFVNRSPSFYYLGFNVRREPLGNPRFRRVVARLLDKRNVAENLLGGYATPTAVPAPGSEWIPADLRWYGSDPEVPFVGEGGDVDVSAARDLFREAGYRYTDDGKLLLQ